ncbi:IS66 family insertion sequence element accessory protein TnpB [Persicimonas caeni]|uniref:IS66 family insertion sequence element accessory protein TnpB n=1 Tax=Persicimonas caeni TaxID=2292766 RepID=A0A4Y6PV96_PERCE|nr:IS66 family insertion sequence element accessory protein TnpB [Persicimonas caeni]QDG50197.1 IS66 family insertion sequence element accessory protein TnpB [Persicimonas caeni]QDG52170.1 IS66 family insertion sequence element accessory protein TnpB [Persicimonas caeni]QDG52519.1 IS66 family insertion sequence element accessory protein TnpB [Persicimonas caeni]QED31418.1 IS66 family insertion sequence element accessory protein TnpB [Persicimonas caeni]QED33392.1 IS66 family insertion sequence
MLTLPRGVRIYLAREPVDMRKGIDGLSALVRQFGEDVFSGHLFVFISKRGDRLKILTWDTGGFVVFYKRLEKGTFKRPKIAAADATLRLDAAQLTLLLEGIDFSRLRRPKLWQPPETRNAS